MTHLISESSYLKMPWKNKRGVTSQIYIEPQHATLEKLDFDFRLSSAPINENGPFSKFPGFQRVLLPIKGKGFFINGGLYELHEVAHFSGDEEVQCELADGDVLDLGLIFNPTKLKASARVLRFKEAFHLNSDPDHQYLVYVLQGRLALNDVVAKENETLFTTKADALQFKPEKSTSVVFISLAPLT